MNTTTTFFASRTLAQISAKGSTAKFKDQGKDSPKGERWSTVDLAVVETVSSASTDTPFRNKMEHAKVIVNELEGERRKVVIESLMRDAHLTKNGANTYYYKIKALFAQTA